MSENVTSAISMVEVFAPGTKRVQVSFVVGYTVSDYIGEAEKLNPKLSFDANVQDISMSGEVVELTHVVEQPGVALDIVPRLQNG